MQRAKNRKQRGITLVALIITVIYRYDYKFKIKNNNGFLLVTT